MTWTSEEGVEVVGHPRSSGLIVHMRDRDGVERSRWAPQAKLSGWITSWGPDDYKHVVFIDRAPDETDDLIVVYVWANPRADGTEQDPRQGGDEWRLAPVVEAGQ